MANYSDSNNATSPQPNIKQRTWVLLGFGMVILLPLCTIFFMVDSDRWLAQWQVWWGLTMAEETAQAPIENAQVYTKDDEWFVTYQFDGINALGELKRFEKTEEVSKNTVEKIEAEAGLMVDYVVGNPSIAGLETNHNPFSRFGLMLIIAGAIALRVLGRGSRRSRRAQSVVGRLSQKTSEVQNPDWVQQMSEPRNVEKTQKAGQFPRLIAIMLLTLILLVQLAILAFFLLGN